MEDHELISRIETILTTIVKDHLEHEASFDIKVEVSDDNKKQLNIVLIGEDLGLLIGYRGKNLDSLQYVLSHMIMREYEGGIRVNLDVNDYKQKRHNNLARIASKAAQQVLDFGVDVALEPMNAADRRIVHMTLQDDVTVETLSEGTGFDRHVVIKPARL